VTDEEIRQKRDLAAGALYYDYGFNEDVVALADEALRRAKVWAVTFSEDYEDSSVIGVAWSRAAAKAVGEAFVRERYPLLGPFDWREQEGLNEHCRLTDRGFGYTLAIEEFDVTP
jgi:hypothetical protein